MEALSVQLRPLSNNPSGSNQAGASSCVTYPPSLPMFPVTLGCQTVQEKQKSKHHLNTCNAQKCLETNESFTTIQDSTINAVLKCLTGFNISTVTLVFSGR